MLPRLHPLVLIFLSLSLACAARPATATRLDSSSFAEALIRSQKNTKNDDSDVSLDPICSASAGCGTGDVLSVPFNTRSYYQQTYDGLCDATPFGSGDYSCADFGAGSHVMSGQTLTFEVDLSGDDCGCNAALYLVSMPCVAVDRTRADHPSP